jgi:virulence-associated protein VagC
MSKLAFSATLLACTVVWLQFASAAEGPDEVPFEEGKTPPLAKPGEVWCLQTKPATYRTITEAVETSPSTFYTETIPARFEMRPERVLVAPETKRAVTVPAKVHTEVVNKEVKPACERLEIVPAVWEWRDETVILKPESESIEVIPAVLRTVTEQVLAAPARTEWRKTDCKDRRAERHEAEDCYMLVEVPAQFNTVTKTVVEREAQTVKHRIPAEVSSVKVRKLIKPEETKKIIIPAVTEAVTVTVIDTPATVVWETIPARFETVQKQVEVAAASTKRIAIPAKFETITKTVLDQPAHMVWHRCMADVKEVITRYHSVPGCDEKSLDIYEAQLRK